LLAITNLLSNNIVQQWFHEHPMIQAAERLLQEVPVNPAVLKAQLQEIAPIRSRAKALPTAGRKTVKAAL